STQSGMRPHMVADWTANVARDDTSSVRRPSALGMGRRPFPRESGQTRDAVDRNLPFDRGFHPSKALDDVLVRRGVGETDVLVLLQPSSKAGTRKDGDVGLSEQVVAQSIRRRKAQSVARPGDVGEDVERPGGLRAAHARNLVEQTG